MWQNKHKRKNARVIVVIQQVKRSGVPSPEYQVYIKGVKDLNVDIARVCTFVEAKFEADEVAERLGGIVEVRLTP